LSYSPEAIEADMKGVAIFDMSPQLVSETQLIAAELDKLNPSA
jgi:hypothetical protein